MYGMTASLVCVRPSCGVNCVGHPLQAHLNTSFKHFIFFVHEFNLIEKRELSPMQELIDRMMRS